MLQKNILKVFSSFLLAILIYFVGFQQGCSPVVFSNLEPLSCEEFPKQSHCEKVRVEVPKEIPEEPWINPQPDPQETFWKYNYEISLGSVAFLFVIDISSSMAVEHRNLANQLSPFLKSIKNLKYHIGIITMDISSSPNNPVRGAPYQDGKFIPIGGRIFLTNENLGQDPSIEIINDFKTALQREETQKCDSRNQPYKSRNYYDRLYEEGSNRKNIPCPSSDERGTYAVNLALENPNYREFFNRDHVMTIFISDEDVRSGDEFYNQDGFEMYQLEEKDRPETLVYNFYRSFPKSRTFSFHSIIIKPGDSSCLNEQNKSKGDGYGTGRGYYGDQYAKLARAGGRDHDDLYNNLNLLRGSLISICDKNYSSQLGRISIFAKKSKVSLPCDNPESISLSVNGKKVRFDQEIEGRTLYVESLESVNLSARLEVEVLCKEIL